MKLIGLSGKIHTGKSFLASILVKLYDNAIVLNFGDILKKEVARIYNFDIELCYTMEGKDTEIGIHSHEKPTPPKAVMTVRELLQWYATDYIRAMDSYHWVSKMKDQLVNDYFDNALVILADIRFPNEADLVTGNGGKVIRLLPYPAWCYPSDHESETALDEYELRRCFWLQIAPPFGKLNATATYIKELLEYE